MQLRNAGTHGKVGQERAAIFDQQSQHKRKQHPWIVWQVRLLPILKNDSKEERPGCGGGRWCGGWKGAETISLMLALTSSPHSLLLLIQLKSIHLAAQNNLHLLYDCRKFSGAIQNNLIKIYVYMLSCLR